MKYYSTRDKNVSLSAAEAVKMGLSRDGGLLTPTQIPQIDRAFLERLIPMEYAQRAAKVMALYLTDYSEEELLTFSRNAYGPAQFDDPIAAPVRKVEDGLYCLELWHGPTSAFKDMALQMLPQLLSAALRKTGEKRTACILAATSGDTGKAAMAGFADVPQTCIQVYYPKDGVSPVQERQMVTQEGENVDVRAVIGNFDDAQAGVKRIFSDETVRAELDKRGYFLSSANSINWGRILPQVVYYISAYCDLLTAGDSRMGQRVNFCVPTGNFGDILAAYYAKRMGLPVGKLICASNDNKVLYDFFQTGSYDRNREFVLTSSPSMDILISSNLERLIYTIAGQDAEKDTELMNELKEKGVYEITPEMKERLADFRGGYATEAETAEMIHDTYKKTGYVMDTHTAVAAYVCKKYREESKDTKKCLVASTASPYKFARSVMTAIDPAYDAMDEFQLIDELNKVSGFPIPNAIEEIRNAEIRHTTECDVDKMKETVKKILGV